MSSTSRRSPERQAEGIVRMMWAPRAPRSEVRKTGAINSLRTRHTYRDALTQCARWMVDQGYRQGLHRITLAQAQEYLSSRASQVTQSTLDADRSAINTMLRWRGDTTLTARAHSTYHAPRSLRDESRAYTAAQVAAIAARQSPPNALASRVAHEGGLRAAELHTIRRIEEAPRAPAPAHPQQWLGREHWPRYMVTQGKGGYAREVRISPATAAMLERTRIPRAQRIVDRRIGRERVYQIGGGQAWSQSFLHASRRALGWSSGGHGLRHSYVQSSIARLCRAGLPETEARTIVSEEVGHHRPGITRVYER